MVLNWIFGVYRHVVVAFFGMGYEVLMWGLRKKSFFGIEVEYIWKVLTF